MRPLFAVALLLGFNLPAAAQMVTIAPEQLGQIWCIGSLGNDMAPAAALLTPNLTKAIDEAQAKSDALQQQRPDEKPPLGDGVPWRSVVDYADACTVLRVDGSTQAPRVQIQYGFSDYPDANYVDTLLLEPVVTSDGAGPVWRIGDVEYADTSKLSLALVAMFETY